VKSSGVVVTGTLPSHKILHSLLATTLMTRVDKPSVIGSHIFYRRNGAGECPFIVSGRGSWVNSGEASVVKNSICPGIWSLSELILNNLY
jgi:hypothetical protein